MSLICSFFISQNTVLSILEKELQEVSQGPCAVGCNCNLSCGKAKTAAHQGPCAVGYNGSSICAIIRRVMLLLNVD